MTNSVGIVYRYCNVYRNHEMGLIFLYREHLIFDTRVDLLQIKMTENISIL